MADIGATTTRCALLDDKGQELAPEIFAERRLHRRHRRAPRVSRAPSHERPADARSAGRRGADHRRRRADDQHRLALLAARAATGAGPQAPACRQRLRRDRVGVAAVDAGRRRAKSAAARRAAYHTRRARPRLGPRRLGARARGRRLGRDERRRRPCHDASGHATRNRTSSLYCGDRFDGHCSAERSCRAPGS